MLSPTQALASGGLGPNPAGHFIYAALGHDQRPLYIGRTCDVRRRLQEQHTPLRGGEWFKQTTRFVFTQVPTLHAAVALEAELIDAARPPFNKVLPKGAV